MTQIPTVTLANGVEMPAIGLGVFMLPPEETVPSVQAALNAGCRLIDTAAAYQNEAAVGEAVRSSGIAREDIFITSKLWNRDQGYDATLKAFDATLDRLGLDYLDLYLIHWPLPASGLFPESWRAFEELYEEGRIRAIGVSNFTPAHLETLAATATITPMVLQVELHPFFTQPALRDYARAHAIQLESWFPLGGRATREELLGHPLLQEIAAHYQKTPAQIILRWHTQLGLVPLPGSSSPAHIEENMAIFDFSLSDTELADITALNADRRLGADPDTMDRR